MRIALLALAALFLVSGLVLWADKSPIAAGLSLLEGSLGSKGALNGTLKEFTPLLVAGIAVFLALRAGLFNIGVEGQLIVGAMCCTMVALWLPGPLGLVLGAIASAAAGAAWAWPAGWIKATRGGHEVITTIMLNNVASHFARFMTDGPIKAPGQQHTTTERLSEATMLPAVYESLPLRVSSGVLIGLLLLIGLHWWLRRTVSGFEWNLVGANPKAARLAGVDTRRVTMRAMAASGAFAGLAGAIQVLAYEGRFYAEFSPGYGFDALGVAILAGGNALGILPAALLFGVLAKGAASVQIFGVPKGISVVLVGLLIVVFAAVRYRKEAPHD